MLKKLFCAMFVLSFVILAANSWTANEARARDLEPPEPSLSVQAVAATNLLANPEFDDSFYFRPTNHLVANMWFEWFWAAPFRIPEFIDGGHPYHNVCYPLPAPGSRCENDSQHNGSQGYILMASTFVAGVYQAVPVASCGMYQFQVYDRNDAYNYRPKVGIDPTGQVLPPYIPPDGDTLPINCPPNGHSKCPNPGLSDPSKLPPHIVWSAPVNPPPYTFTPISVTAEAMSTTISVWTYAAPEVGGSQSSYWDHASLIQVLPPSGALPVPATLPGADGFVVNVVSSTTAIRANLSWRTNQLALTQVLYHWVGSTAMTTTPPITTSVSGYELRTAPGTSSATAHSVRLTNLRPQSYYDVAILARHVVGSACQTSVYTGRFSTTDILVPTGPLPAPSSDIIGPYALPGPDYSTFYFAWQSAQPSYGQVMYHYFAPPTIYPTMTQRAYLPLVASSGGYGFTYDYELRTPADLTFATLHVITVTGLITDSFYAAVAVSAWSQGELDRAAVSPRVSFSTAASTLLAAQVRPGQLIEQLQACVADGKKLDVCIGELSR